MSYQIGIIVMGQRMTEVFGRLIHLHKCELAAVADPNTEGVKNPNARYSRMG